MKCKDCDVGKPVQCPHCKNAVIWCGEEQHLVDWHYWDNEEMMCDGIYGG